MLAVLCISCSMATDNNDATTFTQKADKLHCLVTGSLQI